MDDSSIETPIANLKTVLIHYKHELDMEEQKFKNHTLWISQVNMRIEKLKEVVRQYESLIKEMENNKC